MPLSTMDLTDPEQVAELIDFPTDHWGGNCHGVSVALRQAGLPGRVRRGWHPAWGGQHSWVELPDGSIVDATLTALLRDEVNILVIPADDPGHAGYDPCGWRGIHGPNTVRHPPNIDETERELIDMPLSSPDYVADLLGLYAEYWGETTDTDDGWIQCSVEQAFWLANLPVVDRESRRGISKFFAAEIYEVLDQAGMKGAIPTDNWHYVMDEPYPHEPARP